VTSAAKGFIKSYLTSLTRVNKGIVEMCHLKFKGDSKVAPVSRYYGVHEEWRKSSTYSGTWGELSAPRFCRFTPGYSPQCLAYGRTRGSQNQSPRVGEEKR
jgi:hypothetical protein